MNGLPPTEGESVHRLVQSPPSEDTKKPKYLEHIAAPQRCSRLLSRSHNSAHLAETVQSFKQRLSLDWVFVSSFESNGVQLVDDYQGLQWFCLTGLWPLVLLVRAGEHTGGSSTSGRLTGAEDCRRVKCFISLV